MFKLVQVLILELHIAPFIKINNMKRFKWFRRSYLKKIYKEIESERSRFCCLVFSWHRLFCCWEELKEVKENHNSFHLTDGMIYSDDFICSRSWFYHKHNRLAFLKECLDKLK